MRILKWINTCVVCGLAIPVFYLPLYVYIKIYALCTYTANQHYCKIWVHNVTQRGVNNKKTHDCFEIQLLVTKYFIHLLSCYSVYKIIKLQWQDIFTKFYF